MAGLRITWHFAKNAFTLMPLSGKDVKMNASEFRASLIETMLSGKIETPDGALDLSEASDWYGWRETTEKDENAIKVVAKVDGVNIEPVYIVQSEFEGTDPDYVTRREVGKAKTPAKQLQSSARNNVLIAVISITNQHPDTEVELNPKTDISGNWRSNAKSTPSGSVFASTVSAIGGVGGLKLAEAKTGGRRGAKPGSKRQTLSNLIHRLASR